MMICLRCLAIIALFLQLLPEGVSFCLNLKARSVFRPHATSTMMLDQPKKILKAGIVALSFGVFQRPLEALAELQPAPWNNAIQYEVLTPAPNGGVPKVGDLVAIRFIAKYKDSVIDDTFKSADAYYYRCGVGSVVKGLDEAVTHMHEGERSRFQFGGDLAFGSKGIKSAPGRPRIPPNADITYEVLLEKLPGTGDDFIADEE